MLKKVAVFTMTLMLMPNICLAQDYYEIKETDLNEIVGFIMNNYIGDITEEELINAAISGMTDALDEYSEYYYNEEIGGFIRELSSSVYKIGIVYKFNDEKYPLIIDIESESAAEAAGLQKGDVIKAVEGEDIKGCNFQDVTDMFFYAGKTELKLDIIRNNEKLSVNLELKKEKIETVNVKEIRQLIKEADFETNDKIGYIAISTIADETFSDFSEAVDKMISQGKTKLVLDLRGNLGGSLESAIEICRKIVPKGIIIITRDKQGNEEKIESELEKCPFEKIAVITDSMTASAAEVIASALQDSKAGIVVGSRTYGKGVIQRLIPVSDIGILKMTTQEYFSRNSNRINKTGVRPDIPVDIPYFISVDDPIYGSKVVNALNYLNYKTGSNISIQNSIGEFQEKNGLDVTKELNKETVNKINLEIYNIMSNDDRTLKKAIAALSA